MRTQTFQVKTEDYYIDILQNLEIELSEAVRYNDEKRFGLARQDIEITKHKLAQLKR